MFWWLFVNPYANRGLGDQITEMKVGTVMRMIKPVYYHNSLLIGDVLDATLCSVVAVLYLLPQGCYVGTGVIYTTEIRYITLPRQTLLLTTLIELL